MIRIILAEYPIDPIIPTIYEILVFHCTCPRKVMQKTMQKRRFQRSEKPQLRLIHFLEQK